MNFEGYLCSRTEETYFINLFVGHDSKKIKAKQLTSKKDR